MTSSQSNVMCTQYSKWFGYSAADSRTGYLGYSTADSRTNYSGYSTADKLCFDE
jgi:hypothetical protein